MKTLLLASLLTLCLGAGATVLADDEAPAERPFVFVLQAKPKAGQGLELLAAMLRIGAAVEGQPGHGEWLVLEPREEDGLLTAITTWTDRQAFVDWHDTDAYRAVHGPEQAERLHSLVDEFAYRSYDVVGGSMRAGDLAGSLSGGAPADDPGLVERLHRHLKHHE